MIEHKKWVEGLFGNNFLAVYDVVLDIRKETQLSDDVHIRIVPTIVRFENLMPADGINMRDDYGRSRWQAAEALKKRGLVRKVEVVNMGHRWEAIMKIEVDKVTFEEFGKIMDDVYKARMASSLGKKITPDGLELMQVINQILDKFHSIALQIRKRHENRPTLTIADEYDVQDLLHALLLARFDDIRPEEWTPSYAGKSSRVDFLLKREHVVIEVKMTRVGLTGKKVGEQLIIDISRYAKMTDCQTLVCFVYDPDHRVQNPKGFEADLSGDRDGLNVHVMVRPNP